MSFTPSATKRGSAMSGSAVNSRARAYPLAFFESEEIPMLINQFRPFAAVVAALVTAGLFVWLDVVLSQVRSDRAAWHEPTSFQLKLD
jgi:hypothetical protein